MMCLECIYPVGTSKAWLPKKLCNSHLNQFYDGGWDLEGYSEHVFGALFCARNYIDSLPVVHTYNSAETALLFDTAPLRRVHDLDIDLGIATANRWWTMLSDEHHPESSYSSRSEWMALAMLENIATGITPDEYQNWRWLTTKPPVIRYLQRRGCTPEQATRGVRAVGRTSAGSPLRWLRVDEYLDLVAELQPSDDPEAFDAWITSGWRDIDLIRKIIDIHPSVEMARDYRNAFHERMGIVNQVIADDTFPGVYRTLIDRSMSVRDAALLNRFACTWGGSSAGGRHASQITPTSFILLDGAASSLGMSISTVLSWQNCLFPFVEQGIDARPSHERMELMIRAYMDAGLDMETAKRYIVTLWSDSTGRPMGHRWPAADQFSMPHPSVIRRVMDIGVTPEVLSEWLNEILHLLPHGFGWGSSEPYCAWILSMGDVLAWIANMVKEGVPLDLALSYATADGNSRLYDVISINGMIERMG